MNTLDYYNDQNPPRRRECDYHTAKRRETDRYLLGEALPRWMIAICLPVAVVAMIAIALYLGALALNSPPHSREEQIKSEVAEAVKYNDSKK